MNYPTEKHFINIHSHRKPQVFQEWVLRNAFHFMNQIQIENLKYDLTVGVHPWFCEQFNNDVFDNIKNISVLNKVFAIGEIGLDRVKAIDFDLQKEVFDKQLGLAQQINKPVIIHAVKSYSDIITYLKKYSIPFIFHQFNGNNEQLGQLLKFNHTYFSFGKDLLLINKKVNNSFLEVPINRLFLETDTSSYNIKEIYIKAAILKHLEIDALKKQVFLNFASIFRNK